MYFYILSTTRALVELKKNKNLTINTSASLDSGYNTHALCNKFVTTPVALSNAGSLLYRHTGVPITVHLFLHLDFKRNTHDQETG